MLQSPCEDLIHLDMFSCLPSHFPEGRLSSFDLLQVPQWFMLRSLQLPCRFSQHPSLVLSCRSLIPSLEEKEIPLLLPSQPHLFSLQRPAGQWLIKPSTAMERKEIFLRFCANLEPHPDPKFVLLLLARWQLQS